MEQGYDAIVIGAGHNGLTCAAYLGKAGLRTIVLERRDIVGGATVTEEVWPGYKVSTASYVVSLLSERVVADLDLQRHGYRVYPIDPAYFAPLEGDRGVLMWEDPRKAAEELAGIDGRDAARYPDYSRDLEHLAHLVRPLLHRIPPGVEMRSLGDVKEALGLGTYMLRRRKDLSALVDLMTMSCADFLERYFRNDEIKGVLAPGGVIGMWGGPMSPGSAYVLLHHRMGEVDGMSSAWGFVRGGMGTVAGAIASSAAAAGVEIRTGAEVAGIGVDDGKARSVRLADGTELSAPIVASGIHPQTTFLDLVGRGHLPDDLVTEIEHLRTRSASAKVNFALSELPDYSGRPGRELGPQHPECIISPSLTYLERAWDAVKYGHVSERPMIDAVIPTTKDDSIAPEGKHIMTCFTQYVPYSPADGPWDGAKRDALADRVADTFEEYAPGFKGSIEHRQVLTPFDLEERFGLLGGNIFHGEMALDQLLSFRPAPQVPAYSTPVKGLYLCGSGTHPGGGVMGIPGYNAARVIVRDKNRADRRDRAQRRA
ncbi:MAG: FAD-dependent oxidoreductase [Actinobacteria bacterium]|nr:FAD-dependent oxidoreductase [Actinomycetota bacterium]